MDHQGKIPAISHLSCREIQAPLVSALIHAYGRKFGEIEALEVAREVIREDAIASGESLAEKYSGNSLEVLLRVVQEVWGEDGTMEIDNLRMTEETLEFDVTSCGYARLYERLGLQEMGCVLSCHRDFPFMEGFNPGIELRRTMTLMEGADHCDFRYRKK